MKLLGLWPNENVQKHLFWNHNNDDNIGTSSWSSRPYHFTRESPRHWDSLTHTQFPMLISLCEIDILRPWQACHEAKAVAVGGGYLNQASSNTSRTLCQFSPFLTYDGRVCCRGLVRWAVTGVEVKPRPWPLGILSSMPSSTSCSNGRRLS